MEIYNLEKNNKIEIENNLVNENTQKKFLETTLGKTINAAVDIGIKTLLPDFIDEQIINIKDNLLNYGLKDGIKTTIDDAIDLGKSAVGIITGNFENISQMQSAMQSGGLIDGISELIDVVINKVRKEGIINNTVANTLIQGKNVILDNIENNIEEAFNKQYKSIEYINKYIDNWKEYYNNKNFEGMEKEYKKIESQIKNIAPIEKTIDNVKTIEMLHKLIQNNGHNFNLEQEQLELVEKLK